MKSRITAMAVAAFAPCIFANSSDSVAKAAFDAVVTRCQAAYEGRANERPGVATSLGHSKIRTTGLATSYDIRRTDSLVSPYLATVEQRVTSESTAFHQTQGMANADQVFLPRIESIHTLLFAFQEGAWVFRSMTSSSRYIKDGVPGKPSRVDNKPGRYPDGTPRPEYACAFGSN